MAQRTFPALNKRGFMVPRGLAYESGGTTGSRTKHWRTSGAGPKTAAADNLRTLRSRARDAIRNDPWAKSAIAKLVSSAIGTGIRPYPMHPDDAMRKLLLDLWDDWSVEADADNRMDIYGQQALAARAMFGDGEGLFRLRARQAQDNLSVPLQVQAMEADHLPVERNEVLPNGNEIINGIEFDQVGRRVAYWLWNRHPGDGRYQPSVGLVQRRVPADQIIHLYQVDRAGQARGVTALATVLLRLKTLDSMDDATLVRQEIANLFAGFVTREASDNGIPGVDVLGNPASPDGDGYTPIATLEPGVLQELDPGDKVEWSDPPDAGDNYADFMRQQLMAAAASVGLPYELLTGDLRGVSDRALRVIINEFHRAIEQVLWSTFIHQWCRPVWAAFIDAAVLAGELPASDYRRNRRLYRRVQWVPHGWDYIHPVQDVQARGLEVQYGFRSRSSVILAGGHLPDPVDRQRAADIEREKLLGLPSSVRPPVANSTRQSSTATESQDEQ
ncbi:phage portal protein [Paraburkholderia sp. SARCC-3016]|uniref:phage portal protein n=1 Tax=Paraburkholderia sp. SARCC-3016 TaxID=3058611 RepID=UPI002809B445|nr:phage portal protein [Paraburkholderia sp. SARCC-3016]MDQ7981358.1 phage portal protein [Paraburkholderia sp. SARCC-3016]